MKLKTLGIRSLIAAIFIPLILGTTLLGKLYFVGLNLIIVTIATYEFYRLAPNKNANPNLILGIIGSAGLCILLYFKGTNFLWWYIPAFLLLCILIELFRNTTSPTFNNAISIFGMLFVPLLFGHLVLIRELPGIQQIQYYTAGRWIVMMFIVVWMCDTAAYILGSLLGKHKFYKRISPNKTWEGTIAGFITAVLCAWACHVIFIDGLRLVDSLIIGAICGSVGQLGDLAESQIKRDFQVKDSSALIPGHGGMLDRFDSLTLIAPVVYYYLRFIAFA